MDIEIEVMAAGLVVAWTVFDVKYVFDKVQVERVKVMREDDGRPERV